jgi:transcription initiation factor TFIIIB Brf1 subunit/transcription initiation factor TFIIB
MCADCDKPLSLEWSGQLVCRDCGQVVEEPDADTSADVRINYAENLYTMENWIGSWAEVIHNGDMVARFEHRNAYQSAREYASGILIGYYNKK